MFGIRKKREYFPRGSEDAAREEDTRGWLRDVSLTSGKHTIVRGKGKVKWRPTIKEFQEVTIHSGELNSTDRLYVLEQVQQGVFKMGLESQYGELAGWIKDMADRRFGPDWQCVVGKKESFGSCICPRAGQYLNFSVAETSIILFKSS